MILQINLKNSQISLILKNDGKTVAETSWLEDRSLSEKLLSKIDDFLKDASVEPKNVEKVEVETDLAEGYTSRRILETVAKTWEFAKLY